FNSPRSCARGSNTSARSFEQEDRPTQRRECAMKATRRIINMACVDDQDPNNLPIVSAKERGGKTTMITAVLIDGDKGWFDEAATHGRTPLEQGIAWKSSPEEVPNGRQIDIVWLFIKPDQGDYVYYCATASSMIIDEEAKV